MAIFVALKSPEVEVIGLTTIYGNVYTTLATRNALHLVNLLSFSFCFLYHSICLGLIRHLIVALRLVQLEFAGRADIPVAEGSHVTITVSSHTSWSFISN